MMHLAGTRPGEMAARLRHRLAPTRSTALERLVRQAGKEVSPGDRDFFEDLEAAVCACRHPTVAVIRGRDDTLSRLVVEAFPQATVHNFRVGPRQGYAHARMAAHGPYDVIVDDSRKVPKFRARLFRRSFWHLSASGVYLLCDIRNAGETPYANALRPVAKMLHKLADGGAGRWEDIPAGPRFDGARLSAAAGAVRFRTGHASVSSNRHVLPKLGEGEVRTLLKQRGPASGRVLRVLPPVELVSRCTLGPTTERTRDMPEKYSVPALGLREYVDVVCAPEQVVVQDGVILPDSYRHNMRPRLKNKALYEVAPKFAVPRDELSHPSLLEGPCYYLDNEHRGHFGHVLTEQVAKLWGWDEAKRRHPEMKALVALNRGREMAEWEYALLAAAGISRADVVLVRGPVRVSTLVAASPMLSMPEYVHPDIAQTWLRVGTALASQAPVRDHPARIFCSRRISKRSCHNAEVVEAAFRRHGFEIVFTEDFSLPEQAAMFRRADVIAGFSGSAMFNLTWCGSSKRVVLVSSESYTASNEYMIAAVQGHQLDIIDSRPDIEQPAGRWAKHAFESGFTFDPEREGRDLDRVLASL